MRVLIVGCGYVGLPLGRELVREGHEVFGLRRSAAATTELESAGIRPLFADITSLKELETLPGGFDWVVNCVASSGADATEYRRIYLQGTRNLIEWLAPQPLEKFVYTGSTSVYGQTDGSWVDESSPTVPQAETARVLLQTEKLLLEAERQKNFPAVILRVAGIYGPGRGHWFQQFLKGAARLDTDGTRILNMIHREDVAGVVIASLKRGLAGQTYNAVDDEPVSQVEFYRWLADALGKPMPPSAPENYDARKRGATNKRISNRKLTRELIYLFRFPNFRTGFRAEIQRLRGA